MNYEKAAGAIRDACSTLESIVKLVPPHDDKYAAGIRALGQIEGAAMMLAGMKDK
jgi:hypothetical protein